MLNKSPLEVQLRAQVRALRGADFQQFVVHWMFAVHGVDGFQDIREMKDQGCDGLILRERCSIACYGPDHKEFKKLQKKVKSDHASYSKNWKCDYPNWRVFINRDPSPDETKLVRRLHPNADLWGVERILEAMRDLPQHRRVPLCRLLGVDEALIGRDFLKPLLEDLVADRVTTDLVDYRKRAPDIERKIRANYSESEVQTAIDLAVLTVEQQAAAQAALTAYDETDISRIKSRVLQDFAMTPSSASFADRLRTLEGLYGAKYNSEEDDGLRAQILGLMLMLFAQCLFGRPPGD